MEFTVEAALSGFSVVLFALAIAVLFLALTAVCIVGIAWGTIKAVRYIVNDIPFNLSLSRREGNAN